MRRFSRATKKKSTTILICVLVIGIAFGLAFFFSVRQIKNRYEAENLAIQNQLDSVQNMVYVATKDIPAGGVIDQNSVSKKALILSSFSATVGVSPAKKGIEKVPDIRNTMLHKHKTALKQQKVKVRIFRLWKFQNS